LRTAINLLLTYLHYAKQHGVQLPTSADDVTLLAVAARRQGPCAAIGPSIDSPARRAHSSKPAAAACGGRMTGQTDGDQRTPDRYDEPYCATSVTNTKQGSGSEQTPPPAAGTPCTMYPPSPRTRRNQYDAAAVLYIACTRRRNDVTRRSGIDRCIRRQYSHSSDNTRYLYYMNS